MHVFWPVVNPGFARWDAGCFGVEPCTSTWDRTPASRRCAQRGAGATTRNREGSAINRHTYVYCNNWIPSLNQPNIEISEVEARIQFEGGEHNTHSSAFVVAALPEGASRPEYVFAVQPHGQRIRFTNYTPGGSPFCVVTLDDSGADDGAALLRVRGITQYQYADRYLEDLLTEGFAERIVKYTLFEDGSGRSRVTIEKEPPVINRLENVDVAGFTFSGFRFGGWGDLAHWVMREMNVSRLSSSSGSDLIPIAHYRTEHR